MLAQHAHATPLSATAARLAILASVTYQGLLAILILVRPELDPSWHTISEWALGRHGWAMTLAFLISAGAYAALLVAIRSEVSGVAGRIGLLLLLVCTIGTLGVGLFVTDPLEPPVTTTLTGTLHTMFGSTALVLLPIAALLINFSLARRNASWATARPLLLATAPLPLCGFLCAVGYIAFFVLPLGTEYGPGVNIGWPPRLALLTYAVWLIALAAQVLHIAPRTERSLFATPAL